MSKLQQSKNFGPSNAAVIGPVPPLRNHPVRKLGMSDTFERLSNKGRGRVFNLIFGKKRDWTGAPIPGTGRASRLSKPELEATIADILAKHSDVQQFGRI